MERVTTAGSVVACYREFAPHPALEGRVHALFSFTSRAEPTAARRVTLEIRVAPGHRYRAPMFADGNASVVFDLGIDFHTDDVWRGGSVAVSGRVIGPLRHVTHDVRHELPAMVGVYFHPAQISRFVHVPSGELTDYMVAIENLWGAAALELCGRLATTQTERERLDLLEQALLRRLTDEREAATTVDVNGLAQWVLRRRGRVTIESLADAAGVSRQHLTRVFRERVGISPKLYCRLARFQSALAYARAGDRVDWARAACDLGYADQSHMIAEFREFSSLTPDTLATGRWYHPFIERAKARVMHHAVVRPTLIGTAGFEPATP